MGIARAEGCEAGIDADFAGGLVNAEAQAGGILTAELGSRRRSVRASLEGGMVGHCGLQ